LDTDNGFCLLSQVSFIADTALRNTIDILAANSHSNVKMRKVLAVLLDGLRQSLSSYSIESVQGELGVGIDGYIDGLSVSVTQLGLEDTEVDTIEETN
jgi:hypothetical protein